MAEYSKLQHAALGEDLSLIAALADPAADEQREKMALGVLPFAIFISAILSSSIIV